MMEQPNLQEHKNEPSILPEFPNDVFIKMQADLMLKTLGEHPSGEAQLHWVEENSKQLREKIQTEEIRKLWAEGKKDEVYEKLKNIVLSGPSH